MSGNSDGSTFNTTISADPSQFEQGFRRAVSAASTGSEQINAQFKKIGEAMSSVNALFLGLTATLAGGGALKKFITDANDWNGTAGRMASQLGITTQKASVLNTALTRLGIDSDVYVGASQKLSKQVQSNAQAFDVLGVNVRDASGAYKPVTDLMGEVNQKLIEIKNPIEQNIAGQQVYGKGWAEVRGILKLTASQMAESETRARELGLIVGPEGVAMSKQYGAQMRDLGLVAKSLEVQFGNLLLPVFTEIGSVISGQAMAASKAFGMTMETVGQITATVTSTVGEFVSLIAGGFKSLGSLVATTLGIEAVDGLTLFGNVLKVVEIAFVGLRTGVLSALEIIKGQIAIMTQTALKFADTVGHALKGDFTGAKAAWQAGGEIVEDTARQTWANVVKIANEGAAKADEIAMRQGSSKKGAIPDDPDTSKGPHYKFKKPKEGKAQSRMGEWEAKLAETKLGYQEQQNLQGSFQQFSQASEVAYWQGILTLTQDGTAENLAVRRKVAELQLTINKEQFAAEVAGLQTQAAAWKNNTDERLVILAKEADMVRQRYGEQSKEYEAVQKRIVETKRQAAEQLTQIEEIALQRTRAAQLSELALKEQSAKLELQLGVITQAQMLALEQEFEDKRFAIADAALKDKQALLLDDPDKNTKALAQLQAEIEALEQQHQQKLSQIRGQTIADNAKDITSTLGTIQSSWASLIGQLAQGSISIGSFIKGMFSSVASAVVQTLAGIAARWLIQQAAMLIFGKTTALSTITAESAKAGAGGVASMAAAPFPLNLTAPAFGASMATLAMSFAPLASAYGGYDIPAGLNPLTQLHAREMVLPAKHADVIRGLAEGGGGAQAGAETHYHFNVQAMDGASVKRFLVDNHPAVAAAMTAAIRNNSFRSGNLP